MQIHFGKFLHTERGKLIMSVILGFGLASLFRTVCKDKQCLSFKAAPMDEWKEKIFKKDNNQCVQYTPVPAKCSLKAKVLTFD